LFSSSSRRARGVDMSPIKRVTWSTVVRSPISSIGNAHVDWRKRSVTRHGSS
jgi:hypothetical protein